MILNSVGLLLGLVLFFPQELFTRHSHTFVLTKNNICPHIHYRKSVLKSDKACNYSVANASLRASSRRVFMPSTLQCAGEIHTLMGLRL